MELIWNALFLLIISCIKLIQNFQIECDEVCMTFSTRMQNPPLFLKSQLGLLLLSIIEQHDISIQTESLIILFQNFIDFKTSVPLEIPSLSLSIKQLRTTNAEYGRRIWRINQLSNMHPRWRVNLCQNYLETFSSTGLLGIRFCAANFCVRSLTVPSLLSCRTTRRSSPSSVWLFCSYSTLSLGLFPYHGFFSSESSLFAAFIKGVKSFLLFVLDNLFEGESAFLS